MPLPADVERAFGFDLREDELCRRVQAALTPPPSADIDERPGAGAGDRIGPYELLACVGSGGMGVVWRARRLDKRPDRIVALKLIRHDLNSRNMIQRFRVEEQVLARLEHPHIARLYDGGVAAHGQPYLVMEFIDGMPIDAYVKTHALGVAHILDLMRQVCDAIHYAHRSLVLHRDIKPGNILVTERGVPKLLDFGIAKILDESEELSPGVTATDARVLTPRYASPEQVRGERLTTATDVYSLGVILFELLTGTSPYHLDGGRTEIERAILDQEAPRPSTMIAQRTDLSAIDRRRLRSRLRGDLDTIVATALHKDPTRRYASAEVLAHDMDRHLRALPITAAPDSMAYRCSRFVHRNKGLVAGLGIAVVALFAAITVSVGFGLVARERSRTAETINAFLNDDLLSAIEPDRTENPDLTIREALDRAAERIEGRFEGQSGVEASIRHTIGWTYRELGLAGQAIPHLQRAVDLRRAHLDTHDADTRDAMRALLTAIYEGGQIEDGHTLGHELLELDIEAEGADSADAMATRHLLARYGGFEEDQAEPMLRMVYDWSLQNRSAADPETLEVMHTLANWYIHADRFADAQPILEDTWRITTEHYGRSHSLTLDAMQGVAFLYAGTGRQEEAIQVLQDAVAIQRETKPENYPDTGIMLGHLGMFLLDGGRTEEAMAALEEGHAIVSAALGPDNGWAFPLALKLARLYLEQGDTAQADRWMRRVPENRRPPPED